MPSLLFFIHVVVTIYYLACHRLAWPFLKIFVCLLVWDHQRPIHSCSIFTRAFSLSGPKRIFMGANHSCLFLHSLISVCGATFYLHVFCYILRLDFLGSFGCHIRSIQTPPRGVSEVSVSCVKLAGQSRNCQIAN